MGKIANAHQSGEAKKKFEMYEYSSKLLFFILKLLWCYRKFMEHVIIRFFSAYDPQTLLRARCPGYQDG